MADCYLSASANFSAATWWTTSGGTTTIVPSPGDTLHLNGYALTLDGTNDLNTTPAYAVSDDGSAASLILIAASQTRVINAAMTFTSNAPTAGTIQMLGTKLTLSGTLTKSGTGNAVYAKRGEVVTTGSFNVSNGIGVRTQTDYTNPHPYFTDSGTWNVSGTGIGVYCGASYSTSSLAGTYTVSASGAKGIDSFNNSREVVFSGAMTVTDGIGIQADYGTIIGGTWNVAAGKMAISIITAGGWALTGPTVESVYDKITNNGLWFHVGDAVMPASPGRHMLIPNVGDVENGLAYMTLYLGLTGTLAGGNTILIED